MDTADKVNAAITLLGVVIAVFAWWKAKQAQDTAARVDRRDADRRQAELRPDFEVKIDKSSVDEWHATLKLKLVRPIELRRLDSVVIRIRDDGLDHYSRGAGGPTPEDVDRQIWGRYGIRQLQEGDKLRHTRPFPLDVDQWHTVPLMKISPPTWMDGPEGQTHWHQTYGDAPVRLFIECTKDGYEPWEVPYEVAVDEAPPQSE